LASKQHAALHENSLRLASQSKLLNMPLPGPAALLEVAYTCLMAEAFSEWLGTFEGHLETMFGSPI